MRRPTQFTLALTAATLAVVACAGKEKSAAGGAAAASAAPATPPVVTIHARDYSFDAPAEIDGGIVTFQFVNDGPGIHHATIVRLDSGKTVADLDTALRKKGPLPAWLIAMGGPNAPDPRSESNATLDLEPGHYAILCFVDLPGGVPHFARGMVRGLTVKAPPAGPPATMPVADINVSLNEYAFELSKPLSVGTHTFAVTNAGTQPHEVEIVKLKPGKTLRDFGEWMDKQKGPPPANLVGGMAFTTPSAPHGATFTATLTAGDYLLICFVPDAKDGKPHFIKGMIHEAKIS